MKNKRSGLCGRFLSFGLVTLLVSCGQNASFVPYEYGALNTDLFVYEEKENYARMGDYASLACKDKGEFDVSLPSVYSFGFRRHVLPSVGENDLTVIPVDFPDVPASNISGNVREQLSEAFFGNHDGNQFFSLAEYYDKASLHRLHVKGEVAPGIFTSAETYQVLKGKNNASQTKAALTRIYNDAIAWHNQLPERKKDLSTGDPVYFVYLAPYSGMDESSSSRSSMMWAFTVNDPAPICWSSYYMMHQRDDGKMDAHTFIHEFGHMLGLKDYYDLNSYSDISACSPMGRMDMMDCSLGDHNAFSKMLLNWTRPFVPKGECEITLRPGTGNGDCILLPIGEYNDTPFDEYLLLEYYSPTYLNYADANLRADPGMSLMAKSGVRAYHVDARLGVFEDRAKSPVEAFTEETSLGTRSLDFYRDNTGILSGGTIRSANGFLLHSLNVHDGELPSFYIGADRDEDLDYGSAMVKLRRCLFEVGEGIDSRYAKLNFHKGVTPEWGFEVSESTSTYAKIKIVPYNR